MFRFAPALVRIAPGESVTFLNSRGEHTVHAILDLWPEGAPTVSISNQSEVRVQFDAPGLYGFRCARHGRYGMTMLVVVGPAPDAETAQMAVEAARLARRERDALERLAAEATRAP